MGTAPSPKASDGVAEHEHPHEDAEADDEQQHRQLHAAEAVAVERVVPTPAGEVGIGVVELLLDLPEDALLVLGKRHRTFSPSVPSCGGRLLP